MAIEHETDSALARAVRQAGSQSAFGRLIGKRQSVVHDWLKAGAPLPAEYVLQIEAKLEISRHELRPDIYPPEEYSQSPGDRPGEASAEDLRRKSADAHDGDRHDPVEETRS